MFSKVKKQAPSTAAPKTTTPPAPPPAPPSIISADLIITGNLESAGEVQVDGRVNGDICAKDLLVGNTADIHGEITADSLRVHGRVTGQIKAKHVFLAKTSHVVGDILHEFLSIEEGAFLEGLCRRLESKDLEKPTPNLVVAKPAAKDSKSA